MGVWGGGGQRQQPFSSPLAFSSLRAGTPPQRAFKQRPEWGGGLSGLCGQGFKIGRGRQVVFAPLLTDNYLDVANQLLLLMHEVEEGLVQACSDGHPITHAQAPRSTTFK